MATIRPLDLAPAASVATTDAFIVDKGSAVEKATAAQIIDAAIPLASQAEAEAGSDNAKRVTPLRVKQAIEALGVSAAEITPIEFDYIVTPATSAAEINALLTVDDARVGWVAGYYYHANLTGSGDRQVHRCLNGVVTLWKNANGRILDHSGDDLVMDGFVFRGEAATYTGGNVRFGGTHTLVNYGSRDADEEAIESIGRVRAYSPIDIVQSVNADYDWVIGSAGGDNLYSYIEASYSSQNIGGVKTIDCGSLTLLGGQIAKLWISKSGAPPAGINGGNIMGMRILGVVQVDVSNATFTGNTIDADITLGAGTAGIAIDGSNILSATKKVINNGNLSNFIVENDSSASGIIQQNYGGKDKATSLKVSPDAANGYFFFDAPNGTRTTFGYYVNGTKVVGAQSTAVANATDAASAITQLNALLTRLRAHGLIAT